MFPNIPKPRQNSRDLDATDKEHVIKKFGKTETLTFTDQKVLGFQRGRKVVKTALYTSIAVLDHCHEDASDCCLSSAFAQEVLNFEDCSCSDEVGKEIAQDGTSNSHQCTLIILNAQGIMALQFIAIIKGN